MSEHWSNDAENSALHYKNKLKTDHFFIVIIITNVLFLIKQMTLVTIRDLFQNPQTVVYACGCSVTVRVK